MPGQGRHRAATLAPRRLARYRPTMIRRLKAAWGRLLLRFAWGKGQPHASILAQADPTQPIAGALARHPRASHILFVASQARLAPQALARIAAALDAHPGTDMLYADEDQIDAAGHRHTPFLKPAWSIDLALEQDLAGALLVLRRPLLERIAAAGIPAILQDLALLAAPVTIRHIPAILAHRTTPPPLGPSRSAVEAFLETLPPGPSRARIVPSGFDPARQRIRWAPAAPVPRVTVIIPTRDHPALLARCASGILQRTDYDDIEVLIADNDSRHPDTHALFAHLAADPRVRIIRAPGPFNYSAINNAAAAAATGEVLVLLNNDIEVIAPHWLAELAGHAVRPDVGAVGARLLFENGTIQHAGIVLGVGAFEGGPGLAGHFGLGAARDDPGHAGQFITTREVSAVTGACLALRRAVYLQAGGLDEANLPIALNDLDLCLRIRALGYRIVYTPFAELYHLESASRGSDQAPETAARFLQECRWLRDRWGAALHHDPYYNPAFSRFDHSFQLAAGPPVST